MAEKLVLALDQGTTSSRSIVFDKKGNIIAKAQNEFEQIYPKAGWVEHDPLNILYSQFNSITTVLRNGNFSAKDIAEIYTIAARATL
jgi:glycerol kinase